MHLVRYRQARDLLMATPPNLPQEFVPDIAAVRPVIDGVLRERRIWLDPIEMTTVLLGLWHCDHAGRAGARCRRSGRGGKAVSGQGRPVVLKIQSPDIVHKSEVGGVRLNLGNERVVREAAADILGRAREAKPEARINGVTVFPMIVRPKARELIVGIADDPTFGPVIVFGQGGTAVEVIDDKALALPPLDLSLANG